MMKHISVTDTTIRQAGKAAGYTLSFREKIELAKLLDRLGRERHWSCTRSKTQRSTVCSSNPSPLR